MIIIIRVVLLTNTYVCSVTDGLVDLQGPVDLRGAEDHLPGPLLHPLLTRGFSIGLTDRLGG